jgi:nucleotide-binding universal stress UspA family protein
MELGAAEPDCPRTEPLPYASGMTVVVGYVPDATGYLAVTEAARQAQWRGTEVVVVNVIGPGGYTTPTPADEQQLDALAARLTDDGVRFSIRHLDQELDHVSDEILRVARETGADLIVVGMHRRSAVAKMVLGSNAQRVLLEASCPVLSVRADEA